ncbi:MAG TPA: nucleotide disphospho-sugar-binding domain-containing protein [Solirubrobacteraceae bacterium]|nr:nucleotide disphospho-sugar-binding domain-containing protein [Solirubrobacteraceae bacterium]
MGAFGDPGHAFPMIALGERLAARGHHVTLETWERWREPVQALGMDFAAAPEYDVFPTKGRALRPYEAAVRATNEMGPLVERVRPDAVVADILTLAPALAAEVAGVPRATLVPHVFPPGERGFPPYSLGARLPRSALGRALWGRLEELSEGGLRRGRDELNETRRRLGLDPVPYVHSGISRELCLVGTFPQLEYPRRWPPWARVVGPLMWEPPFGEVELPPGDGPLVLIAPSTSQDPTQRLLRAALRGLAGAPVRVLATTNRRAPPEPIPVPANARLVDWVSYSRTMPRCDVVVCHGGHGTVVRALASACAVVAVPAAGDMNENAARIAWAGLGTRVPNRFATPRGIRLAVERCLADPAIARRTAALAAWLEANDPADRAADAVEALARARAVA